MIDELHAQNIALIKDVRLYPHSRLTAITGETGAGKTAILGALKLLIGERADSSLIREGSDGLQVEGRFFFEGSSEGVAVRRSLSDAGRSRSYIDGSVSSVSELSDKIGSHVDLCGQHEHQKLLSVHNHLEMLDLWGGKAIGDALETYRRAFDHAHKAQLALDEILEAQMIGAEILEQENFVLRRIDQVAPAPGELEKLEQDLPRVQHAESLLKAAYRAKEALSATDGAEDCIAQAQGALEEVGAYDEGLASLASRLQEALIEIEDGSRELSDYLSSLDFNPEDLEQMESRYAAIQGLMRVYGPSIEDVFERRDRAQKTILDATCTDTRLADAEKRRDEAEAQLAQAADALTCARQKIAPEFCQKITDYMGKLELANSYVIMDFKKLDRSRWSWDGPCVMELMYCPGKNLTPRPLRKIASGGEISRVTLAIKCVLGQTDTVDTLVFDEVDAGVGGSAANALAEVLKGLSHTHQVIVVTHLAQVASLADRHYKVAKTDADNPETTLTLIEGSSRRDEIARMLSGSITEASLQHAEELLTSQ